MRHVLAMGFLMGLPAVGSAAATPFHQAAGRSSMATPPHFVANHGQFPTQAQFVGRFPGMMVRAEREALLLQCLDPNDRGRGALVRMSFPGGAPEVSLGGEQRLPIVYSYFRGNDPSQWQRDVGAYGIVRYRGVHPGVDLVLRDQGGQLEYDVLVEPGADLSALIVRCEGTDSIDLEADGTLVLQTSAGPLRQPLPVAWEELGDGARRPRACRFQVVSEDSFGFEIVDRNPALALVIDPGLFWSTYLGGSIPFTNGDIGQAIACGPGGTVTAVGEVEGLDFPETPGAFNTGNGPGTEVFVTRLSPDTGSLIYSCIIGGAASFQDRARSIHVDAAGRATVAGYVFTNDFPTTPGAWDRVKDGPFDAFVLRLNAQGTDLEYSTFLGGPWTDQAEALAVAPNGAAIVGGFTGALPGFPTTAGAFDTTFPTISAEVGFVARLSPDGSALEWSTLLGEGSTYVGALALDADESVIVAGRTVNEVSFPTTLGAWIQYDLATPTTNAFVCRLSPNGSSLQWSALFGGNGADRPFGVATLPDGGVIVAGIAQAYSTFPVTPGVIQTQASPSTALANAFIVRLRPDGSAPVYSTLLGQGLVGAKGLAVDPSGVATIGGFMWGSIYATPGAHDIEGIADIGIVRINPTGTRVLYSTYLGGLGQDDCKGLAMTPTGRVSVVGDTTGDYPTTTGAAQPSYGGGQTDALVSTLDLIPTGVRGVGRSTHSCRGPIVLNAIGMPRQSDASFGLYASGGPHGASGWLVIGSGALAVAQAHAGVALWLDPLHRFKRVPVTLTADGYLETAVPELVAGPVGTRRYVQLVVNNTAACGGLGTRSASNALEITVQ